MAGKAKRLNKVAKEYNVSISTIVDFLATKGFEIDSKPNTKIEGEILEVLEEEYADDKLAKEKSKKVAITREKRESVSLKDVKQQKKEVEEVSEDFSLEDFKKSAPVKEVTSEKEEVKEVEKEESTKEIIGEGDVKLTVVDKIDLDSINQKTRPDRKKKTKKDTTKPKKPAK
ncbi:MAG TPA: hypothetical protein EYG85_03070, partial [Crocinitomix sp.]|nr:hypothetical protein [Crocinitomix sp.]